MSDLRWWYGGWPGAQLHNGDPKYDSEPVAEVYEISEGDKRWIAVFRKSRLNTFTTERGAKMACRAALRRAGSES